MDVMHAMAAMGSIIFVGPSRPPDSSKCKLSRYIREIDISLNCKEIDISPKIEEKIHKVKFVKIM